MNNIQPNQYSFGERAYKNCADLGTALKKDGTVDSNYRLKCAIPLDQFYHLTSTQNQYLFFLLNDPKNLSDDEGNVFCRLSVQTIIDKIKELALKIKKTILKDVDFQISGSLVEAILESDPAYMAGLATALSQNRCGFEAPLPQRIFNDIDLRVYLNGWTDHERLELSKTLIEFYVDSAKKQAPKLIARKAAQVFYTTIINQWMFSEIYHFLEKGCACLAPGIIRVLRQLFWGAVTYESTRQKFYSEKPFAHRVIQRITDKFLVREKEGNLRKLTTLFEKIFEGSLNLRFENSLKLICINIIKTSVFDKLYNGKGKDKYVNQSFSGLELLLISSLSREHQTSRDKRRITVSGEIVPKATQQCFVDHALRVTRLELMDGIDFLKMISYITQGQQAATPLEVQQSSDIFKAKFTQLSARKFLEKYLINHHYNAETPLNSLCFLFNCAYRLTLYGHTQEKTEFLNALRRYIPRNLPQGWARLIHAALYHANFSMLDIVALLQTLYLIYQRKKIVNTSSFEFIQRNDLEEPILMISLQAVNQRKTNTYIGLKHTPKESLERSVSLLRNSESLRKVYHQLYALIINDKDDPTLQLMELAEEMDAGPYKNGQGISLWTQFLEETVHHPKRGEIIEFTRTASTWSQENIKNKGLRFHAPTDISLNFVFDFFQKGNFVEGWNLLEEAAPNLTTTHLPDLQRCLNLFLEATPNNNSLGWNLVHTLQTIKNLSQLPSCNRSELLSKGIRFYLTHHSSFDPNWAERLAGWTGVLLDEKKIHTDGLLTTFKLIKEVLEKVYAPTTAIVEVFKNKLIPLLNVLRNQGHGQSIYTILNLCRTWKISFATTPSYIYCVLEGLKAMIASSPSSEIFEEAKKIGSRIVQIKDNPQVIVEAQNYLIDILKMSLEKGHFSFAETLFIAWKDDKTFLNKCSGVLEGVFDSLWKDPTYRSSLLALIRTHESSSPAFVTKVLQKVVEDDETHFNSMLPYWECRSSNENHWRSFSMEMQAGWHAIFKGLQNQSNLSAKSIKDCALRFSSLSTLELLKEFVTYLRKLPFNPELLDSLGSIFSGFKFPDGWQEEEYWWIELVATDSVLHKNGYERLIYMLKNPASEEQRKTQINLMVKVLMQASELRDGQHEIVGQVYAIALTVPGAVTARPELIEALGRSKSQSLQIIAYHQTKLHIELGIFPTHVSSQALSQNIMTYMTTETITPKNEQRLYELLSNPNLRKYTELLPCSWRLWQHFWKTFESSFFEAYSEAILNEIFEKAASLTEGIYDLPEFQKVLFNFLQRATHPDNPIQATTIIWYVFYNLFLSYDCISEAQDLSGKTLIQNSFDTSKQEPFCLIVKAPRCIWINNVDKLKPHVASAIVHAEIIMIRIGIQTFNHPKISEVFKPFWLDFTAYHMTRLLACKKATPEVLDVFEDYVYQCTMSSPKFFNCNSELIVASMINHAKNSKILTDKIKICEYTIFHMLMPDCELMLDNPTVVLPLNERMLVTARLFERLEFATDLGTKTHLSHLFNYLLRFSLTENFAYLSHYFDKILSIIKELITYDTTCQDAINLLKTLLLALTIYAQKNLNEADTLAWRVVCDKLNQYLIGLVKSAIHIFVRDSYIVDVICQYYYLLKGSFFKKYDEEYCKYLRPFFSLIIFECCNVNEKSKTIRGFIYNLLLGETIVRTTESKKLRAQLFVEFMKAVDMLDATLKEAQNDGNCRDLHTHSKLFLLELHGMATKRSIYKVEGCEELMKKSEGYCQAAKKFLVT